MAKRMEPARTLEISQTFEWTMRLRRQSLRIRVACAASHQDIGARHPPGSHPFELDELVESDAARYQRFSGGGSAAQGGRHEQHVSCLNLMGA